MILNQKNFYLHLELTSFLFSNLPLNHQNDFDIDNNLESDQETNMNTSEPMKVDSTIVKKCMKLIPVTIALATLCFLSACGTTTSLQTQAVNPHTGTPIVGAIYAVPSGQFETTITRQLVECVDEGSDEYGIRHLKFSLEISNKMETIAGEWFAIDYQSMGGFFKTSSLGVELYENQTLKSINGGITDQSTEVVDGLIDATVSLIGLATITPVGVFGAEANIETLDGQRKYKNVCSDKINEALINIKTLSEELEGYTKIIKDNTEKLKELTKKALKDSLSPVEEKEIEESKTNIVKYSKLSEITTEQLYSNKEIVSFSKDIKWVPNAPAKEQEIDFPFTLDTNGEETEFVKSLLETASLTDDLKNQVSRDLSIFAKFEQDKAMSDERSLGSLALQGLDEKEVGKTLKEKLSINKKKANDGQIKAVKGILVRIPSQAQLEFWKTADKDTKSKTTWTDESPARDKPLFHKKYLMPQFGSYNLLPLVNKFGENNTLKASFSENGALTSLNYDSKKATGVSFSKLANDLVDGAVSLKQANDMKEINALNLEIAKLEKQKSLQELNFSVSSSSVASKQIQAELNAKLARLQAEKQIRDLELALSLN